MDNRLRLSIVIGFMLVFLAGCTLPEYKTALELINEYGCATCKPGDCTRYNGEPCGEEYLCCTKVVPEEHRYIFDCKYEPLIN